MFLLYHSNYKNNSLVSLIHTVRKLFENQRSNADSIVTKTRTPTLEHRYECLELRPPWSHDKKYQWSENIYDALMAGLRPPTTQWSAHGYRELMKLCWNQLPSRRPGFDVVYEKLQRIRQRSRGKAPKHSLSGAIRSVVRGTQSIEDKSEIQNPIREDCI